ncbi:hypothetical protein BC937DRAFT_92891 [Endogone sp. FLAS-F59071]|nr:hypothetical protein BC937DRAFT_92891 [Endogone sp. FLAS-F59071]|eukprot:RUS15106.1 hypothetical protein BC937DRAFT_92891 [Endogone sp. FLAS-F59071]
MGPKASKLNDDNMIIIRGSKALAHAYAVNVMAIYVHYRWRYHSNFEAPGAHAFSSLSLKDGWQDPFLTTGTEKWRELQFWFGKPFGKAGRMPQAIQHINGEADDSELARAVEKLSISEKKPKRRAQKKREEEEEEEEGEEEKPAPRRRVHKAESLEAEKPAPRRRSPKAEGESKAKPARAVRGRRGDDDAYHPGGDDDGDDDDIEDDEDEDYEPKEPVRCKAGGARKKKVEGEEEKKPRRKVGAGRRRKKEEYEDEDEDEDEDDDYESEPEKTTRNKAAPRRKVDVAPEARPQVMSGGGGQRNESSEGCAVM